MVAMLYTILTTSVQNSFTKYQDERKAASSFSAQFMKCGNNLPKLGSFCECGYLQLSVLECGNYTKQSYKLLINFAISTRVW